MLQLAKSDQQPNSLDTVHGVSKVEYERMKKWLNDRLDKGKKEKFAEFVVLTPVLAELLLPLNTNNRPIGRYALDTLKSDVVDKRWIPNSQGIGIAKSGVMTDGQHRCFTVKTTGVPIETLIVFGLDEAAKFTTDIGKPKTAANFLHMKGMSDTNNLAATLSLIIEYRRSKGKAMRDNFARPTKTQVIAAADEIRGVQASVDIVQSATKRKLGSRSCLAFCHYLFKTKAGVDAADEFMMSLLEGDGLRKGSPIYYCRDRLISMDRGTRAQSRIELILKCWNAWRRGETITKVQLNGTLPKKVEA